MTEKFIQVYEKSDINKMRACENCGRKRALNLTCFFDSIAIECDICEHGKILYRKTDENLSSSQVKRLEDIVDRALSQPDSELAMYTAKAEINKMK